MKIRIELDEKLKEDEVLIRTSRLTDEIAEIQKTKRVFVHIPSTTFIRRSISSMNGRICCRVFLCGCQNPPF